MDLGKKMISVEQALSLVKSNDHIVSALAPAEGAAFLGSLHTIADRVKNVTVTSCLPMGNFEYMTNRAYADSFNVDGWFFTPALRKAMPNGNVSHVPQQLSTAALKRLCHLKCNIFIGNCSMPDKHGYVSLGLSNTYETYVMERADIVILEINPNVPRTFGDVFIPVDEVDYFIDADYAIPEIPDAPCNEKDLAIGKTIAEFINDGDTIQLGIGGIPNAVAESLYGLKHLGVHTELYTTGMMKLTKAGVIDNSRKTLHKGSAVTTMIIGTRELYDFVDDNPGIMVMNGMYTNDAYVIGQNDNQISINTTLEVDLTGQLQRESGLGSVLGQRRTGGYRYRRAKEQKRKILHSALFHGYGEKSRRYAHRGQQNSASIEARRDGDAQPKRRAVRCHRIRRGGFARHKHKRESGKAHRRFSPQIQRAAHQRGL